MGTATCRGKGSKERARVSGRNRRVPWASDSNLSRHHVNPPSPSHIKAPPNNEPPLVNLVPENCTIASMQAR